MITRKDIPKGSFHGKNGLHKTAFSFVLTNWTIKSKLQSERDRIVPKLAHTFAGIVLPHFYEGFNDNLAEHELMQDKCP